MLKDVYIYPAILTYTDKGISIEFPDLPGCLPCADTSEEAVKNAKEALGLHIWGMEKDNDPLPEPTEILKIHHSNDEVLLLVEVFMPPIRDRLNNKYVKKTLSIPQWLNAEAEHAGVNFSLILQNGLKEYLHLQSVS